MNSVKRWIVFGIVLCFVAISASSAQAATLWRFTGTKTTSVTQSGFPTAEACSSYIISNSLAGKCEYSATLGSFQFTGTKTTSVTQDGFASLAACTAYMTSNSLSGQCASYTTAGTDGTCTGNTTKVVGSCRQNCITSVEKADGTCTAASGASFAGMSCCVASSAGQSSGTCTGNSGRAGSCYSVGNCPSGTATDGSCNNGDACCTASAATSGTAVCAGTCRTGTTCNQGEHQGTGACSSATQVCCESDATTPTTAGTISSVTFTNPLQFDTVQGATATFLDAFQGIIVMLALIFIVLGGIMYITSAGDDKKIGTAKKMITAAMIGLAIGVAAPSFLKEIGNILGWGGAQVPDAVNSARSATEVAQSILDFLLSIVGLLAMIMLVIGGLMYFAAAGDEKRADTAKNIVKYSIMGLSVAIVSLIIVRTIAGLL